jgi:hypothetical protein
MHSVAAGAQGDCRFAGLEEHRLFACREETLDLGLNRDRIQAATTLGFGRHVEACRQYRRPAAVGAKKCPGEPHCRRDVPFCDPW